MKKVRFAAASLAVAGTSLLAPTMAGADPWVVGSSQGAPVLDGATGALGQTLVINGAGCDNASGTAVMGQFAALNADPATVEPGTALQIELPVDASGSFEWTTTIPLDNPVGQLQSRWYCATAPVSGLDDPSLMWVAPVFELTIEEGPAGAAPNASLASTGGQRSTSAATASSAGPTFTVDPDALPLVDRIGIPGATAAKLKAKVDAQMAADAKARAALAKALKKVDPKRAAELRRPATNEDYVRTAYQVLLGKAAPKKALAQHRGRLDQGVIRVQVVEDIALSAHSAAWWNRKA